MRPSVQAGQLFVYWVVFGIFAILTVSERPSGRDTTPALPLVFGGLILALLIGLRFKVGGDWLTYERMFDFARYASLGDTLAKGDPAYQLLNWLVKRSGARIWLVNLVCGVIFAWGLFRFARTQASPWAVFLVAFPYLVIVVAMGYSRQGVAIGLLLAGIAALLRGASIPRFAGYVILAALFHKTAIVALLVVLVSARRNLIVNLLFVLAAAGVLYDTLLAGSVDRLVTNYVLVQYDSQGAAIRVAMSVVPAGVFLMARKKFGFSPDEDILWRNFSYAAFITAVLLLVVSSSTVVDRLALYVLPLQLAIIARIPGHLVSNGSGRAFVIVYALAIQYVWLNFAAHARYWLPYQFYPFGS